MTPNGVEKTAEILIVAIGALVTLFIAAALLYWIDREWREPDARGRRPPEAAAPPDPNENPDESPPAQPPES